MLRGLPLVAAVSSNVCANVRLAALSFSSTFGLWPHAQTRRAHSQSTPPPPPDQHTTPRDSATGLPGTAGAFPAPRGYLDDFNPFERPTPVPENLPPQKFVKDMYKLIGKPPPAPVIDEHGNVKDPIDVSKYGPDLFGQIPERFQNMDLQALAEQRASTDLPLPDADSGAHRDEPRSSPAPGRFERPSIAIADGAVQRTLDEATNGNNDLPLDEPPPRSSPASMLAHPEAWVKKTVSSPLVAPLWHSIRHRGPISIFTYMRECLVDPEGFYMQDTNVIGRVGDFITSPEISQMFGEVIGTWCVSQWMQIGAPSAFNLVEFGPGRGTLMSDILRVTTKSFPEFTQAMTGIHFIELENNTVRTRQRQACSKYAKAPMVWHSSLDAADFRGPSIFLCHEFFDALPIYCFKRMREGWREILVDIDDQDGSDYYFRFVVSPNTNPSAVALDTVLPHLEPNCDYVEVGLAGQAAFQDMCLFLKTHGGVALVIDYGANSPITSDSLRGIQKHQFVSVLNEPGRVDISADVDFFSLRNAATAVGVTTYGAVDQADFLINMGVEARLLHLLRLANSSSAVDALTSGYERLLDRKGMGTQYKVLAAVVPPAGVAPQLPYGFS